MNIEPITVEDLNNLRHLQPEGWSDIFPDLLFYINSDFCNPVKMAVDESIAGIGASIRFHDTAWLAHIIVDAGFRNRGIGYQIVEKLLNDLENSGISTCLLTATELGQPVYTRAGFRNESEYIFLARETPWTEASPSSNIVPFSEEFRQAIFEMDMSATGEGRDKLLSPCLMDAKLYIKHNKMMGYFLPGLREGLIVAENEEAGLDLMNVKYASADKAILPAENRAGVEFLIKRGFAITDKKGTRMIRGNEVHWKPEMIYSRIGGNVG